jgi:Domain of unknown function (DUF5615)
MSTAAQAPLQLVLDEMFSPKIAAVLRGKGHAVIAVAERVDLRAPTDDDLYAWAVSEQCWLLTENVKDFRPIMLRALQTGGATAGLLFTSSRTFPRSRQNPGPLIDALHAWLSAGPPPSPLIEDWLNP